jgi:hypothetical protein
MQTIIEENDGIQESHIRLDDLKQEWEGYVNNSINAMPI